RLTPRLPLFPTRRSSDLGSARTGVRREAGFAVEIIRSPCGGWPNEETGMSAETLFGVVSTAIVPGWLLIAAAPRARITERLVLSDRKSTRLNSSHDQISY